MNPTATSDFLEDEFSSGRLRLRTEERYGELDFAHAVRIPEELVPEAAASAHNSGPDQQRAWAEAERNAGTLVRAAYHGAIAMFIVAIGVGTVGNRPLVAFALGFVALALCGFGNYAAARMGQIAWIPVRIASRVTIGSLFLALTALLVAKFN